MSDLLEPKSLGEYRWKCPLCYSLFISEHVKDVHMVADCPYRFAQDPLQARRGSTGKKLSSTSAKKEPSLSTGGGMKGKQSVILTWIKQLDTCVREIYFFDKSGDMFTLHQDAQKHHTTTSSSTNMNIAKFECQCLMEVGEHEGSLNLSDSGVYEVVPFKIKNQTKPLPISIRTTVVDEHKPKSSQAKGTPKSEVLSSQSVTTKQTSREMDKLKEEIETLKTNHAIEKEELLKREEKHKQTITQLKGRVAEKDRELSFKEEKLKNLEDEMGRFSEKSHQIFDKYTEDKSKYDESKTNLEEMRKELQQHKHMFTVLEKEKHELEENNNVLIKQGEEFQNVISSLKSELHNLQNECSVMRQQQEIHGNTEHRFATNSTRTDEQILSLNEQIRQLKDTIAVKDNLIQNFSGSEIATLHKNYSKLEIELRHLKAATNPETFKYKQEEKYSVAAGRKIFDVKYTISDLELELTLKTSECDDLKIKVASLKSELKEAHDLLASKLESPNEFEDLAGLSVSQSLGADFKKREYTYHTQQATDAEQVRNLKTQVKELLEQISNQSADIAYLQNLSGERYTENQILKTNLDTALKEDEKTKLQLKQTEENLSVTQSHLSKEQCNKANPTKSQTKIGTVAEKQPQYAQVAAKQNQSKYTCTNLVINGKYQQFYTLNQVKDPNTLVGELIVCRTKWNSSYLVGTLKVIIPRQYTHDKARAGIEFIDPLGDSNGEYCGKCYFQTNHKCAIFLPTNEVYMYYNKQTM